MIAKSDATQRAAEALLRSGASLSDTATILGDRGIQGAFNGLDQTNARLASDPDRLQTALDDFAGIRTTETSQSSQLSSNNSADLLVVNISGDSPSSGLSDALRAVAPVAGALADLADRSLLAAELLVAAGQAAVGGGSVGHAIKQLGRIAGGQAFEQLQDRAATYVSERVSSYLTNNSGLDTSEISLLSAGAGFGTNLVLGSVLGVKSTQVIGDASNVRNINNKVEGLRREREAYADLQRQYPNASVQPERMLLDANGNKVLDPFTGTGRRIDNVVIQDGKVIDSVETTSMTAAKRAQVAHENRVRQNGGGFIQDVNTGEYIDISSVPTRLDRRP